MVTAKDIDDGASVESGDGDAGRGKEENKADVLDEEVTVFVVGVGGVVGESGEHDVDDTVYGHDEHVFDLGNELVNANDIVRCKESEEDHFGLRVHAGGDAGDKERSHRLEVSTYVEFLPRTESDESVKAEHVEDVGSVPGEDYDSPINAIVPYILDEDEHEDETDEFDSDAADGNVSVLFDGLIEPFDAKAGKPQSNAEYEEQWTVLAESWHDCQSDKVDCENNGSGDS